MGLFEKIFSRNKIPEELSKNLKDADRIEIRYPLTLNDTAVSLLPKYNIRAVAGRSTKHLGEVYISTDRLRENKGYYVVHLSIGKKDYVVGKKRDLVDADTLAHKSALDEAHRIAKFSKLPLEDLALDDKEKLEDDELSLKISLISQGAKLKLFITSFLAGIALSILSLRSTGNVISDLTGSSQGLFGLTLFVVGIAGLVFGKK